MAGFLNLSRDIIEWGWFKDQNTLHLFIYLLFKANWKDGEYMGQKVTRGQLVTGLKTLAEELGLSIRNVRTALNHLKSTNEVTIKSTNKFSIVTICKYDKWVGIEEKSDKQNDSQSDKQLTSNRQATDKQPTTSNKYNNIINQENNIKEDTIVSKKERPLWKTSYEEYRRLFEEAKQELLSDNEFKAKQEGYYPGIDYEKSIEKEMDYWLTEETWKKVAREKAQTILPKERLKNNFDKNKIYKPNSVQKEQKDEMSFMDRHTKYVQWLAEQVKDPYAIMPILHVTLDDFIEMFNSCGGDSMKLAKTTISLLRGDMNKGESLISAFRRNKG